jgi:hypothetical protein
LIEQFRASGVTTDWSMTFVFERVIPALKQAGMTDEQLAIMMVENPKDLARYVAVCDASHRLTRRAWRGCAIRP